METHIVVGIPVDSIKQNKGRRKSTTRENFTDEGEKQVRCNICKEKMSINTEVMRYDCLVITIFFYNY
jgi:hypothetical protein